MLQEFINFFEENYFVAVYGVTLIISIITYKKYFDTELKYFPILIAYTFFNELLGYFVRFTDDFSFFSKKEYSNANDLIYNIYEIVFYGFFFFIYWKLAKSRKHEKWILTLSIISLMGYTINSIFQNPIYTLLYWASAISSWMLFICTIFYLVQLQKKQERKLQTYNLMLWISISIAIFYFFFPVLSIIGLKSFELWQQLHLRTVLRILIVVMYVLFSIGFIVSKKRAFC